MKSEVKGILYHTLPITLSTKVILHHFTPNAAYIFASYSIDTLPAQIATIVYRTYTLHRDY